MYKLSLQITESQGFDSEKRKQYAKYKKDISIMSQPTTRIETREAKSCEILFFVAKRFNDPLYVSIT